MIALQHQGLNPADAIRRRRSGLDAEAGRDERPAPLTPSPTASYRFLGSTGMQPVEAGNLTAFSIGLKPVEDGGRSARSSACCSSATWSRTAGSCPEHHVETRSTAESRRETARVVIAARTNTAIP